MTKLKCLWKSGRNARLTVTTKHGKAWANLNVGLGCLQGHHQPEQGHGNSHQRRNERRAKARMEAAAEATDAEELKEIESGKAEEAVLVSVDGATADEAGHVKLVIQLDKEENEPAEKALQSPILQVDGAVGSLEQHVAHGDTEVYSFVSKFGEEDILWTLQELFTSSGASLLSRVRVRPMKAEHLCTVSVKVSAGQTFTWPDMRKDQEEVFQDLKRILK